MDAVQRVIDKISAETCAELALGKVYSPWGQEGEATDTRA